MTETGKMRKFHLIIDISFAQGWFSGTAGKGAVRKMTDAPYRYITRTREEKFLEFGGARYRVLSLNDPIVSILLWGPDRSVVNSIHYWGMYTRMLEVKELHDTEPGEE